MTGKIQGRVQRLQSGLPKCGSEVALMGHERSLEIGLNCLALPDFSLFQVMPKY